MSFRTSTRYCTSCNQDTVHEEDAHGVRCIPCLEKKERNQIGKFKNEPDMSARRFAAALDGAGNRGEQCKSKKS
jgi:hypothetical protein